MSLQPPAGRSGDSQRQHLHQIQQLHQMIQQLAAIQAPDKYRTSVQAIITRTQQILAQRPSLSPSLSSAVWIVQAEAWITRARAAGPKATMGDDLAQGVHACEQAVAMAIAGGTSGLAYARLAQAMTIAILAWHATPAQHQPALAPRLGRIAEQLDQWEATVDADRQRGLDRFAEGLLLTAMVDSAVNATDRRTLLSTAARTLEQAWAWFYQALDMPNAERVDRSLTAVRTALDSPTMPTPLIRACPVTPAPGESRETASDPAQTPFVPTCAACATPLPPQARFCRQCGARVGV
jgi:hypothetical protein